MLVLEASALRRIVCCAATLLVSAAVGLGDVMAVLGTSQAAIAPKPAPVPLKTIRFSGGLTIALQAEALARLAPAGELVDAGMRFSMVGMVCDTHALAGEVMIRLRTSSDGRSWSSWRATALEQIAQAGIYGESYIETLWIGSGRYLQVSASGGAPWAKFRLTARARRLPSQACTMGPWASPQSAPPLEVRWTLTASAVVTPKRTVRRA